MKVDEEITATLRLPTLDARQLYLFTGLNAHEISLRFGYSIDVARRLVASLTLGKMAADSRVELLSCIKNGDDVADYVRTIIGTNNTEVFYALYLNANGRVLHQQEISHGSLTASLVHPREVLLPGVTYRAATFIVAHNHPSGDTKPSAHDKALTRRLKRAGKLVGIEMLDHVVVSKHGHYSFCAHGLL
jgi:DNA repair protein RadC